VLPDLVAPFAGLPIRGNAGAGLVPKGTMISPTSRPHSRSRLLARSCRWIVPALLLATTGCAMLSRGRTDNPFAPTARDEPVQLQIQNDNFNDARIYVLWGGQRQRLGMVTGKTSETFEFAWRPADFRIQVDFLAAGGFTTDMLVVWPGEVVYLQIPPN